VRAWAAGSTLENRCRGDSEPARVRLAKRSRGNYPGVIGGEGVLQVGPLVGPAVVRSAAVVRHEAVRASAG